MKEEDTPWPELQGVVANISIEREGIEKEYDYTLLEQ